MYSFKEKQKHFAELQNSDAAALDLQLLSQKNPQHPYLSKYSRNPQRYANEILYQLLDVAKRDEIRKNRRPPVPENTQPESKLANISDSQKKEDGRLPVLESKKEEKENVVQNPPSSVPVPELQAQKEEVTDQLADAEERAEEAELHAEEAEERADNAEAALKEEKKKVVTTPKPDLNPKVKFKSGKNIPKSTGTTSRTRKSRQPQSSTTTEL